MLSYVTLFLIASSAIRRTEVRSFMTYTLGWRSCVALGMIIEYRTYYNPFWSLSDQLLPGFFTIQGNAAGDVLDHIGRRLVRGPAELPLEAVAMLSMALPIAVVRVLHEPRSAPADAVQRRDRRADRIDVRDLPQERSGRARLRRPARSRTSAAGSSCASRRSGWSR